MLTVRPATASDSDALALTVSEGFDSYREFAPEGWRPPDRLELAIGIAVRMRDATQHAWIAEDPDGVVAGQVAYMPAARSSHPVQDETLGQLGQLFVRRPHWGTGLASRLLHIALEDAVARGFATMRLFTPADHARARRFYEREGWAIWGEPRFEQALGLTLVEYRRRL